MASRSLPRFVMDVKRLTVAYMETGPFSDKELTFLVWDRELPDDLLRLLSSRVASCVSVMGSC